ncbi:hypothetical protein EGW08_021374, partial [Elysia chlorotica]
TGDYSFNTGQVRKFGTLDYLVFVLILMLSTAIGLYQGWRSRSKMTVEEYFTANQSMHPFPVSLSLMASFFSGVTLVGAPVEVYSYSTMNFWAGTNYLIGIGTAAYIFIPVFYQLKVVSCFEVRIHINYIFTNVQLTIFSRSPSTARTESYVNTALELILHQGGARAVIWTDTFQISVSLMGTLSLLIGSIIAVGGLETAWDAADRTGRIVFFEAVLANIPGLCVFFYCSGFIGIFMSAFYENCDPVKAKLVPHSSQISTLFAMDVLGATAGLAGIFVAGVVSATLSSVSSGLNSIAAVCLEDYAKVYFRAHIRPNQSRHISQAICVFFGAVVLETTYLVVGAAHLRFAALSVISLMTAPVTGVFILGILIPQTNLKGAWAGLLSSIFIEFFIFFGKKFAPPAPWPAKAMTCVSNCNITAFSNETRDSLYPRPLPPFPEQKSSFFHISWQWDATIAVTSCTVIGVLVSYYTGFQKPSETDPRLIVSLIDEVWPFYHLSEKTKKYFRFGIDHENKWNPEQKGRLQSSPNIKGLDPPITTPVDYMSTSAPRLSVYSEKASEPVSKASTYASHVSKKSGSHGETYI